MARIYYRRFTIPPRERLMILPYGHEQTSVRRLPWVTFAVMGLCVAVFVGTLPGVYAAQEQVGKRMQEVIEYFFQHPYLDLDPELMAILTRGLGEDGAAAMSQVVRQYGGSPPRDPNRLRAEQGRLDELSTAALGSLRSTPYQRLGLVPAHLRPHGLITHQFMHGGWFHLFGNLFMLFLVGPFIEDVWGRPLYLGFYLTAGVIGAVFFALRYPSFDGPLIGASGAIAGVMGAFLVRYWHTNIKFLYWFFIFVGTFTAPAWLMLPLWFLRELFFAHGMDAVNPGGGGGGVAYWSHVAGFAFGVCTALAIRHWRIEERFIHHAIEGKITLVDNTVVEQALAARAEGRTDDAGAMLRRRLAQDPGNVDLAIASWNLAVEQGTPAEAAPDMLRVIRKALREGDAELAVAYWPELVAAVPGSAIDLATGARMAELLLERGEQGLARETVERAAADSDLASAPPGVLVRLARLALTVSAEPAARLCTAALASDEVPAEARLELQRLSAAALAHASAEAERASVEVVEADEPEIPAIHVPTAPDHQLRMVHAVPTRLSSAGIDLTVGERSRTLPLADIQAVAVAGVSRPNGRPYLLVDLLLDAPWSGSRALRVVRLSGSAFDPRTLVGGESAIGAFRTFLERLLQDSEAVPLPDPESARGNPFRVFGSLEHYEREVLGAARSTPS